MVHSQTMVQKKIRKMFKKFGNKCRHVFAVIVKVADVLVRPYYLLLLFSSDFIRFSMTLMKKASGG